ncbi:MAG TPA: cell surface protein SprA, partial [Candidatus Barnesiella excrementipullorum]|nr:cell surface protein SprA [Candidatus Barnesiella excrementipullorum]
VKLADALDAAQTKQEKDSISSIALDRVKVESLSITGVKVNIKSKNPMPYDPANFTLGYSYNRQSNENPTTQYENTYDHRGSLLYSYTPYVKPLRPFGWIKSKSKNAKFFKEWEINYLPTNISFSTNISRYYYEEQVRDLNSIVSGVKGIELPASVSKNFLWDRQLSVQWNLTKTLNFSLQTMTNARVDEPAGSVNRSLYPDAYKIWQDSVWNSIKGLGTPWEYNQVFNASWTAPFNKIPATDFLSFSAKYNATYNWEKGTELEDVDMGNSISNQSQWNLDGRVNMEQLYNKVPYLRKVNKRFAARSSNSRATQEKRRKFERTITLKQDTGVVIRHNLKSKKVKVSATNLGGQPFAIETRVIDENSVEILTRGNRQIKVLATLPKEKVNFWSEAAQYTSRFLMMVRNVSSRYRETRSMTLPLFKPTIGDGFGQTSAYGPMAPGLDFAFGFTDDSYVQRALDNGWLIQDELMTNPAITGMTRELNIDADIEPITGLKIKLTGNWSRTNSNQIQFMYEGSPTIYGGSFTKTHVAILTALRPSSVDNGYQSDAFDAFLRNREIIAARYESLYEGSKYPTTGFMQTHSLAGQPYSSNNGGVNKSSPDVMIPAFIAAYSGMSADNIALTAFPAISSILPNWRITYEGLMQIPVFKKYFKSFTLNHAYQCTYSVGSYSSFLNWIGIDGEMGYTLDELSGNPVPSSPYDISSVSITERFSPLIGVNMTMKNNLTCRAEYNDSRVLTLNSSAGQIVEATTTDITVGLSYKIANFNKIIKIGSTQTGINNDLDITADFSYRNTMSLIRRIDENYTQATTGTRTLAVKATANYVLSRRITLGVYFDHQVNTPLVSSSAYPVTNSNYGISIQLSLVK